MIKLKLFLFKNSWTLSGPNLTILPVPTGSLITLGWIPNSASESVGSLQRISTTSCYSAFDTSWITSRGLYKFSISAT